MKPKAYLVSIGELPAGSENKRGRLSLKHIEMLTEAAGKGIRIDGYSVSSSPVSSTGPSAPVVTKEKVSTEKQLVEPAPFHYLEDEFKAYEVDTKKVRSMREACRLCRCSLVGCWCEHPEIVNTSGTGNVSVYIVRESDN